MPTNVHDHSTDPLSRPTSHIHSRQGARGTRLFLIVIGAVALVFVLGTTVLAEGNLDHPTISKYRAFKPIDPGLYARAKAAAKAHAGQLPDPLMATSAFAPLAVSSFQGQDMSNPLTNIAPSDSTGAMGTTEYVELINQKIGVYGRSGSLLSSNSLAGWTGLSPSTDELFDVQVLWDPQTNRFYYSMADARNNFANNLIAWGYSKSASPSANGSDWCRYSGDFGVYGANAFPDFPKLGSSRYWLLIGVNRFNNSLTSYLGSDVIWITKPTVTTTITSCPTPGLSGVLKALTNADGSYLSTPVPARQVDPSTAGWVVGTRDPGTGTSTYVTLYRVGKSSTTGSATFTRFTVSLPSSQYYSVPANAPQAGSAFDIDTSDSRITQAIAALDPRFGRTAVWAQHTVAGGAGAKIAWFEIDTGSSTVPPSLSQSGIVSSASLYVFNGAISPDRAYQITSSGTVAKRFGSNMAVGFNTSSSKAAVAIQMVSKVGLNAQSGFVLVKQSPGKNEDFTCSTTSACRWGDYASASPDPVIPTGTVTGGRIWLTNQWNTASTDSSNIDWTTWNWAASP